MSTPDSLHFCDINYSIGWSRVMAGHISCLVGSSRIWCFGRAPLPEKDGQDPEAWQGMELAGEEALHLQGFSLSRQNSKFINDNMTPRELMDLAGNAFNGGVVLLREKRYGGGSAPPALGTQVPR